MLTRQGSRRSVSGRLWWVAITVVLAAAALGRYGAPVTHATGVTSSAAAGIIRDDPSKIRYSSTGLDFFKSHGVLVPIHGQPIDFSSGDFSISITTDAGEIFSTGLPPGAVGAQTDGGFKYHNSDAKLSGGISILKAKRTSDGTFKLTVLCYGDIGPGATTMTTHIFVAGQEWTVTATWRATATGWVFVSAL